jgi:HsdR family type I site-specific deoxyribonuclease
MSAVGQIEKKTQQRVVKLFRETLGYGYLGNWEEREGNRNIEFDLLRSWLKGRGVDDTLITRAVHQLDKAAGDTSKSLYDRNRAVYDLLRYGVKVKVEVGEHFQTVWLVDWEHPEKNHFAIAEEVAIPGADSKAHGKRPDIVMYVNGIALAVLELKRSTVSMAEGIRQNLDNQKKVFIQPFFSTMQWVLAGNDTEGLRYGTIETPEKYYLTWKECEPHGPTKAVENPLDRALLQLCAKPRFLELVHDFVPFDAGVKKVCRHNQYFAVRASQEFMKRREGGIIWDTQGSGKSLIMVWLAKWIREHVTDSRVLIITDRTELDEQIEKVFKGVNEEIYRTRSGADLIAKLNAAQPWLLCSLVHKFGGKEDGEEVGNIPGYIAEVKKALPPGFKPKGDLYVFVDECHRTQSGDLHKAMKAILPNAVFIGFTGTPLLKADKKRSIEIFGRYIHTYKFDEAVKDKVILDLRYEARDIDQRITSQAKIDQWFELKTRGLTDLAKAQLKQRWGTMQKVLSCQDRLEETLEAVRALCEPVEAPRDSAAYLRHFCAKDSGNAEQLKANEPNRLALYKHVAALVRAYAELASEMEAAGYTPAEAAAIKADVDHFEQVRNEVKLASGDYIDLKMYEPAMRHLIDTYIRAEESEKVSAFDDVSLIQLIVERGVDAVKSLPEGIRKNKEAVAEAIENNVRKLIIDEQPINPKYYEKMSQLLDALIEQRRQGALDYGTYLAKIVELTRKAKMPETGGTYPAAMNTPGKRALYDNLGRNHILALAVDGAVRASRQDDWRGNSFKVKKIKNAIKTALQEWTVPPKAEAAEGYSGNANTDPVPYKAATDSQVEQVLELVKNQDEY